MTYLVFPSHAAWDLITLVRGKLTRIHTAVLDKLFACLSESSHSSVCRNNTSRTSMYFGSVFMETLEVVSRLL